MNKDNAKDYLPLAQALAEGKTIQYRPTGEDIGTIAFPRDVWSDCTVIDTTKPANRYRIKPEPQKFWVVWEGDLVAEVWESPIPPDSREEYLDAGWVIEEYTRYK